DEAKTLVVHEPLYGAGLACHATPRLFVGMKVAAGGASIPRKDRANAVEITTRTSLCREDAQFYVPPFVNSPSSWSHSCLLPRQSCGPRMQPVITGWRRGERRRSCTAAIRRRSSRVPLSSL